MRLLLKGSQRKHTTAQAHDSHKHTTATSQLEGVDTSTLIESQKITLFVALRPFTKHSCYPVPVAKCTAQDRQLLFSNAYFQMYLQLQIL
jgi:hypothetical protein